MTIDVIYCIATLIIMWYWLAYYIRDFCLRRSTVRPVAARGRVQR